MSINFRNLEGLSCDQDAKCTQTHYLALNISYKSHFELVLTTLNLTLPMLQFSKDFANSNPPAQFEKSVLSCHFVLLNRFSWW